MGEVVVDEFTVGKNAFNQRKWSKTRLLGLMPSFVDLFLQVMELDDIHRSDANCT